MKFLSAKETRAVYHYKKHTAMCSHILCPYRCKIPVYQLMQTSMSAFSSVTTGDPSNNKGWWCFICVDLFDFEAPPASLTLELHCLHTAASASIWPSVFCLCRLKCFHRSDFQLVFGTSAYLISHVSDMSVRESSIPSGHLSTFQHAF